MREFKITKDLYFSLTHIYSDNFHNQLNSLFNGFNYLFLNKIRELLNYENNVLIELELTFDGFNYDIS
jgi:hypothetical protein